MGDDPFECEPSCQKIRDADPFDRTRKRPECLLQIPTEGVYLMPIDESEQLLNRFLRYVRIDTQADEHSESSPSTAKQLELSRLLADECRQLGLKDVSLSQHGVVLATIPATV